jgi:hypothetical protein
VARAEDTDKSEVLSLLAQPGFAGLVEEYRREAELPEDERERLLIETAWAELLHLIDMGDTKALLFVVYEGDRGRHPENRLRLLGFCRLSEAASESSPACEADEAAVGVVAGSDASGLAGEAPAAAPSDRVALVREEPGRAVPPLHDAIESRPALLGESGAERGEEADGMKILEPHTKDQCG